MVLIDEFQDTDRVQWEIFSTLFGRAGPRTARWSWSATPSRPSTGSGAPTSPSTWTRCAVRPADGLFTLGTNWRSDGACIDAVHALLDGATFGDESIAYRAV